MKKKLTKKQKQQRALIAGIAGLIIGFWMLFVFKNNWGFIPAILGSLLLILNPNG